jgi:hypothetical protein
MRSYGDSNEGERSKREKERKGKERKEDDKEDDVGLRTKCCLMRTKLRLNWDYGSLYGLDYACGGLCKLIYANMH